jgi:hypothetical protein
VANTPDDAACADAIEQSGDVIAEQAGTASRPSRVQAGQADLVAPVDHIPHRVLVGLDQLGNHRDAVSAGGGQQHHRPAIAHRAGAALAHDLLQLLPFLIAARITMTELVDASGELRRID